MIGQCLGLPKPSCFIQVAQKGKRRAKFFMALLAGAVFSLFFYVVVYFVFFIFFLVFLKSTV